MIKAAAMFLVTLAAQISFAQSTPPSSNIQAISQVCLAKIARFSTAFAEASIPLQSAPFTIENIVVDPTATLFGESGIANGTGRYDLVTTETDGTLSTLTIDFEFSYVTEPHCAVVRMQVSGF